MPFLYNITFQFLQELRELKQPRESVFVMYFARNLSSRIEHLIPRESMMILSSP